MSTVLTTIITALGTSLATVLIKLFSVVGEVLKYLNFLKQEKKEEKKKKEIDDYNKKVKDACDGGTVEDLLNL